MNEANFQPDTYFFPYISKPGRYCGGEQGAISPDDKAAIRLLLVYPAEHEISGGGVGGGGGGADYDYQQLYFLLNEVEGLAVERASLYSPDALSRLRDLGQLPFSRETKRPWVDFDCLMFLVNDPLLAARIPQTLRYLRESGKKLPPVGMVTTGRLIPPFLGAISEWQIGDLSFTGLLDQLGRKLGFKPGDTATRYFARGETPQIVPSTGAAFAELKIPLFAGPENSPAQYPPRAALAVARDTLLGINQTGLETVRYVCASGRTYQDLAEVFSHLSFRASLAHHNFRLPPLTPEEFLSGWTGFHPHALQPEISLIFPGGQRFEEVKDLPLAEAARRALALGWRTIKIVYPFDNWESYRTGLSTLVRLADYLVTLCRTHEDKRLVRIDWLPAPGEQWNGPFEYDEQIAAALTKVHAGASQRLPGDPSDQTFHPTEELTRQLLLRCGPEWVSALEALPENFADQKTWSPDKMFDLFRELAATHQLPVPSFAAPVDLSLSPWLPNGQATAPGDSTAGEPLELPVVGDIFGRSQRKKGVSRRRLTALPRRRLRIKYAKEVGMRFFSHLDIVRTIERAIRRSRLPVVYSAGYHPRPKLSFGPPLPVGAISRAEYLDIVLTDDCEPKFVDTLKQRFPAGLPIIETLALPTKVTSLFERINLLQYRVALSVTKDNLNKHIDAFLAQNTVPVQRTIENGSREINVRPFVVKLQPVWEGQQLFLQMELSTSDRGTARPTEVVAGLSLAEVDPRQYLFERLEVFIQDGARRTSPLDFN